MEKEVAGQVIQLSELQKGVGKKRIPRKYNKLSVPEAHNSDYPPEEKPAEQVG